MTLVLLSSSLTMVLGVAAAHRGNIKKTFRLLMATMVCGIAFVVIHATEWITLIHEGVTPVEKSLEPCGPAIWRGFFGLTGMHMLHVTIGVVYLGVICLGIQQGQMDAGACRSQWALLALC